MNYKYISKIQFYMFLSKKFFLKKYNNCWEQGWGVGVRVGVGRSRLFFVKAGVGVGVTALKILGVVVVKKFFRLYKITNLDFPFKMNFEKIFQTYQNIKCYIMACIFANCNTRFK